MDDKNDSQIIYKDNSTSNKYLQYIIYITIFESIIGFVLGIFLRSPLFLLFGFLEIVNLIILTLLSKANYKMSYTPDLQYDYGYGKYIDLSNLSRLIIYFFTLIYFSGLLFNVLYNSNLGLHYNFLFTNKLLFVFISVILLIALLLKSRFYNFYYSNSQQEIFKDIFLNKNILKSEEVIFIILSLIGFLISFFFKLNQYILQLVIAIIYSGVLLYPLIKNTNKYVNNILDKKLPEPILFDFLSIVIDNHSQFCEYKSMRSRRSGDNIFIEIDIVMPGDATIRDSYQLEMKIHNELKSKYPNAIPRIYMTPCNNNCKNGPNNCPFQKNNQNEINV